MLIVSVKRNRSHRSHYNLLMHINIKTYTHTHTERESNWFIQPPTLPPFHCTPSSSLVGSLSPYMCMVMVKFFGKVNIP